MNILSATIIEGMEIIDEIFLETDLPSPSKIHNYNLSLQFVTDKGNAKKYINDNFPNIKIIKIVPFI